MDLEQAITLLPKPVTFLRSDRDNAETFRKLSKSLYDFALHDEKNPQGYLNSLLIDGFDTEQIWQQLELYNDNQMNVVTKNISKLLVKDCLSFSQDDSNTGQADEAEDVANEEESEAESASDLSELELDVKLGDESGSENDDFDELFKGEDEESEEDEESGQEDEEAEEEAPPKGPPKRMLPPRPSVVDDKFFKLSEMEDFLNREDFKAENGDEASDDEESIDFFKDDGSEDASDSEEEEDGPRYKDFFDPVDSGVASSDQNLEGSEDEHDETWGDEDGSEGEEGSRERKVRFTLDDDDDDDECDDDSRLQRQPGEPQSSFEKRQERLKETIRTLEEESLAPKAWQLGGEVVAEARPENALLEEDLVFDHVTRQAPVITEETNRTLEEVIKQRIKDQAWDDVERKIKPVLDPYDFKKRLVLDQEKSKLSLAEVYEQEYLKAQEKKEVDDPRLLDPLETDVNEEHEKIRTLMQNLFCKLDALANYHYTPKLPTPKIQIMTNTPALAVDEVVPIAVSDQALLAPEEIKDKQRGDIKGKTERTETDKKRERRKKKELQHERRLRKEEKERDNKGSTDKTAALEKLVKSQKEGKVSTLKEIERIERSLKSSRAFFAKLQDEVTANQTQGKERGKKRDKKPKKIVSAKRLKTS